MRRAVWPLRLAGAVIILSVVLTPLLGFAGPFPNGDNPSSVGAPFLPAPYVFAIWGLNYLGLLAYGVWLLLPAQAGNARAVRAAPWLTVTALFNLVWIVLAARTQTTPWTVPTLLVMEVSGWLALFALQPEGGALPRAEGLLLIPLRVYLGWLSVATVANSAAALDVLGWRGFGLSPVTWTLVMLVAATAVAVLVGALVGQDNVYRAVFVWAFVGIAVEQAALLSVAVTAGVLAAVITLVIVLTRRPPPRHAPLAQ